MAAPWSVEVNEPAARVRQASRRTPWEGKAADAYHMVSGSESTVASKDLSLRIVTSAAATLDSKHTSRPMSDCMVAMIATLLGTPRGDVYKQETA